MQAYMLAPGAYMLALEAGPAIYCVYKIVSEYQIVQSIRLRSKHLYKIAILFTRFYGSEPGCAEYHSTCIGISASSEVAVFDAKSKDTPQSDGRMYQAPGGTALDLVERTAEKPTV